VHSVGIVVPKHGGRPETVVAGDEVGRCPGGYMHIVDVRNEQEPIEISNFMTPFNRGGNCPYDRPVSRSAIHDVERMIRGNIVWAAGKREASGASTSRISTARMPLPGSFRPSGAIRLAAPAMGTI